MNEEAKKILETQLAMLPDDVRQAIASSKLDENLAKIAKEHNLHLDQAAKLEDATAFLLLGLMNTKEFLSTLVRDVKVSSAEATAIAQNVDRYILSPIRISMREIQQKLDEADREETGDEKREVRGEGSRGEGSFHSVTDDLVSPNPPTIQTTNAGPVPNLRTMPKDIEKLKMEESIRMPKEEIAMRYTADGKKEKSGSTYATDPYREAPQ